MLFEGAVTDLQAVPSAFVPVMKTVISGVEVDLLFARVNLPQVGPLSEAATNRRLVTSSTLKRTRYCVVSTMRPRAPSTVSCIPLM